MAQQIDVERDLKELVGMILEKEPDELTLEAHFVKDLGMDSMMALEVLAGIEKKYRIVIPEGMLAKFINLKETIAIVKGILSKK